MLVRLFSNPLRNDVEHRSVIGSQSRLGLDLALIFFSVERKLSVSLTLVLKGTFLDPTSKYRAVPYHQLLLDTTFSMATSRRSDEITNLSLCWVTKNTCTRV